jgi:hypothetical protein
MFNASWQYSDDPRWQAAFVEWLELCEGKIYSPGGYTTTPFNSWVNITIWDTPTADPYTTILFAY